MSLRIRPYRRTDRAAVYDVCVRTADAGGDARGRWSTDDLMPDLFAGPYVDLEPDRAFVLDDGGRAVGYVLGTADTAGFVRAWRAQWLPRLADQYPAPPEPPRTAEERMVSLLHRPERMLVPQLAAYPAHLHVDLLPEAQGAGWGRALIDAFCAAVAAAGAPGVHLGVDPANARALGFYARLGFTEVAVPSVSGAVFLARPTT
ncbi:GNAT family N-acetyltransferase [Modestobacter sp. VKM Ac-2977]|uniref:GNAT family N-acetyltransferase n=1 Tax=Modestobacter sp. VKM Ac-2977 TaxID=3004131 RepID=UPI0022AB1DEF|nr:GNAT family N-acetyltransferase [Modestobacter sp. VKM Ac-2977]MCZ2821089.1 GNAT family N-acetyltransferase [Modestobacter sp. VKM Ac-2977]